MKIGMMADVYKTQVSGVTNSITLSKQWLEKLGHEVYIFTFGDDEVIDDDKHIIRTTGLPVVDTGIYFNLVYNQRARRLLCSMDIAHVHHPFVSGTLALRYCVPRNIPIVFTNHSRYDLIAQAYVPMLPEQVGEAALKAYLTPFYKACDLVIVPSNGMYQLLEQQFGTFSNLCVIPNGVDLAPYRNTDTVVNRAAYGFTSKDVIAIYVGRLSPEKNLSFLLRAFYGVAMAYDHVRLVLVGDGPDRENLENQVKYMNIRDRVHFTGMVDYKEIPAHLAASDLFVTPSMAETFGLSTVEAMAAGLPTLGIDAPGTSDIIQDGFTGLIASDDLAVFTAKWILLATNHELRKKIGRQAHISSVKYDIQTTTDVLMQHYLELVDSARRRKKNLRYKLTRLWDKFQ